MSFPQVRAQAKEFPATILTLMGIDVPDRLPPANLELVQRFNPRSVVIIMIDNFGLFEAVVYKPEALIKYMEVLALLETDDPYAIPLINSLLRGPAAFHLIDYVKNYGKFVRVVCRDDDREVFGFDQGYTVTTRDDMATYIESTRHIFKSELLFVHFLDFESLYAQYGHRTPPETLLEKIVRRTDNWIKVLLRQARVGTLFIVVGNHGRHSIPLNYEGKLAEWRKANAPIAIMFQKRSEVID
ncbi:MAG TPA: hypothetical protein ENG31_02485 [Candidatus Thorarchaeota archaeon]|nr:MAG: hypothetical protein DRO73_08920 [Candidatus Thorarchaeota archaeon]RLI55637.1 MAG: hypothetical protein DRO87_08815 [Candidatus Thorarchaeota archaeon]HDD67472.1 hypothetical protein [Candidatus Thorarchaeota archaeon]